MKIKRVGYLLVTLLILILSANLAAAAVYINEFLPDGPAPEPDSEWIELYNDGSNPVYLTGWRITDGEGSFTIPGAIIPASGFFVLAYNLTLFNSLHAISVNKTEYGPNSTGTFSLSNTNDNLELYDSLSNLIDSVNFTSPSENISVGRNYDGGQNFINYTSSTPGTYNNRKPVISTIPNLTSVEDSYLIVDFSNYVSDPDNNPVNISISSMNNVYANITGLSVRFTTSLDFNGLRNFTVTASDGLSSTTSNTILFNVTPINDLPTFSLQQLSINEDGVSSDLDLRAYTADVDTATTSLNWTIAGGDSRINSQIFNIYTMRLTPQADYCGTTAIVIRIYDSNITYSDHNLRLVVACIQDSPTINLTYPANSATLNISSLNLQWSGHDVDNDSLVYEVFTGNSASNLTSITNTTSTSYALSGLTNSQTVYWRVIVRDNQTAPVLSPINSFNVVLNNPPTISSFAPSSTFTLLNAGQSLFFQVNVTDPENDALSYNWTLDNAVQSTSSSWTYQTTLTTSGTHTVKVEVTDGNSNPISKTWLVTVNNGNPTISQFTPTNLNPSITEGDNLTFSVTATDPENETLTYNFTFDGQVVSNSNSWTYLTNYTSSGIHTVKAIVTDTTNHQSIITWILSVADQNTAPFIVGTIPSQTQDEDAESWTIDLTQYEGDLEDTGSTLTWSVMGVNNDLIDVDITSSADEITFTPVKDAYGNDTITLILSDSGSLTAQQNIVITLNPINDPPTIEPLLPLVDNPKITENENLTFTVVVSDIDSSDFNRSWYLDNNKTSAITNTYEFVSQGVGTYSIKFVADDGQNISYRTWTIVASEKPVTAYFDGATPNFNSLNETELSQVNLTLEKVPFGQITFNQLVDLRDTVDLDRYAFIGDRFVSLDGSSLPDLNLPATITLHDIDFDSPVILYKSSFTRNASEIRTPCTSCELVSYENEDLTFTVPHFSSYRIVENETANLVFEEFIQLGDDEESQRDTYLYTSFDVINYGTYESIDDLEIFTDIPSKYDVELSLDNSDYDDSVITELEPGERKIIYVRGKIPASEESGEHSIGTINLYSSKDEGEVDVYISPEDTFVVSQIKVDGQSVSDGGSVEIEPDTDIDVDVTIENLYSSEMNVEIQGTIYDLDGDDETDEIDEFTISGYSSITKTLSFSIPDELDEDTYELEVEIHATGPNKEYYDFSWNIDLDVVKEDHDLKLDVDLAQPILTCSKTTTLYLDVENNGANDEDDVKIVVENTALGIDFSKSNIDINEGKSYRTSLELDLTGKPTGAYNLEATVYRGSKEEDQETVTLTLGPCLQETEVTATAAASAQQIAAQHQKILSQQLQETKAAKVEDNFRNSDFYWVMIACLYVITLGAIVFAAGALYIKLRK